MEIEDYLSTVDLDRIRQEDQLLGILSSETAQTITSIIDKNNKQKKSISVRSVSKQGSRQSVMNSKASANMKRLNSLRPPSHIKKAIKKDSPTVISEPHKVGERKSMIIKSKYN